MRIAMAQMHITGNIRDNLDTALDLMENAKNQGADLIFFPEIQLSPFFPKYAGRPADRWLMTPDAPEIEEMCKACRRLKLWASPNVYLKIDGKNYDASLMIDDGGHICGISKMVHIYQAENFYECDYYTPSDDGFKVFNTPFGKIGIVICFDRHIPDSIRSCAKQSADLVLIPTANLSYEPMELFEWEIRVQSYQNTVFTAMCNRVGREDGFDFAGESLIASPDGSLLYKAGTEETLCVADIPMEEIKVQRDKRDWLRV